MGKTLELDLRTAQYWYRFGSKTHRDIALTMYDEDDLMTETQYNEKMKMERRERQYAEMREKEEIEEMMRR